MKMVRQIAMRILWLDMLALAALAFATTAAAPPAGRADETGAGGEVAVHAAAESSASPAIPPPATTADPWWGSAVDVKPKPWLRGTGDEPWRFTAAAYLWLPDAPLEVNLGPIDSSLPEDLGTILGSLQMALMLDFEARKGRFGGYVAPIFVWLRDDDNSVQGTNPGAPNHRQRSRVSHRLWFELRGRAVAALESSQLGPALSRRGRGALLRCALAH